MATPPPPTEPVVEDGAAASQTTSLTATTKPIHSLVLDTGPLIKNDPSVSALVSQAEALYTIPSVIAEIRDAATRSRVETTLLPLVTVRAPGPASVKFVTDFAKRTGDIAVLSRTDIEVIALGYELECERNNGDWRLRNTPGQRGMNGRAVGVKDGEDSSAEDPDADAEEEEEEEGHGPDPSEQAALSAAEVEPSCETRQLDETMRGLSLGAAPEETVLTVSSETEEGGDGQDVAAEVEAAAEPSSSAETARAASPDPPAVHADEDDDASDSDGWITPSNLKKHQAQDSSHGNGLGRPPSAQKTLQAAILTSDYAMQNVALRINLNLVTPSFARITHLKNWVLRCHGCFSITKDMERQFCPRCGQPTLTRASCSTDSAGHFRVHLRKDFQWNKRGNVYSVPKAVHGSASGRPPKRGQGGGKGGWGAGLILAEDQKEYVRMADEQRRRQEKSDPMDEDYLPGILSGRRGGQTGKIRVGAGKNVNSKRKH
ncbi:hypothetical protein E4U41_006271 [Claviceps citrina]|nr:hypothetical protein E4U41_006271 [Claviceps citrina]